MDKVAQFVSALAPVQMESLVDQVKKYAEFPEVDLAVSAYVEFARTGNRRDLNPECCGAFQRMLYGDFLYGNVVFADAEMASFAELIAALGMLDRYHASEWCSAIISAMAAEMWLSSSNVDKNTLIFPLVLMAEEWNLSGEIVGLPPGSSMFISIFMAHVLEEQRRCDLARKYCDSARRMTEEDVALGVAVTFGRDRVVSRRAQDRVLAISRRFTHEKSEELTELAMLAMGRVGI